MGRRIRHATSYELYVLRKPADWRSAEEKKIVAEIIRRRASFNRKRGKPKVIYNIPPKP